MVSRHLRSILDSADSGECSNTLHSSHTARLNAGATHQRDSHPLHLAQTKHQRRKLILLRSETSDEARQKNAVDSADGIYQQGDKLVRAAPSPAMTEVQVNVYT